MITVSKFPPPPPDFVAPHIRRGRYLFLDTARRGPLSLVCAGWEECHPDFLIDRPSFPWHAAELLESGAWLVRSGNRWVPVGTGSVIIYGPGMAGGIRATGRGPHTKYFVDFTGTAAAQRLDASGLRKHRRRQLADPRAAVSLYEELLRCADLSPSKRGTVADALLQALLLRLGAEPPKTPHPSPRARQVFERCRDYLATHYAEVSSLGEAARTCRVGPEYFSRLFRQHTGQTASRFLAQLRMHHAAKLLQRADLTIKAAGQAVGFDDPYHFSRVFKKIHGVAPRDFVRGSGRLRI